MADTPDPANNFPAGYTPPEVWQWDADKGGPFKTNRPTSGATHDAKLPVGDHPLQLYSLATPNGQKATIMLEELLAAGHDAEYDAWLIDIGAGDQFGADFVAINPNSKIPALLDRSTDPATRVFESGSILLYLAEKFGAFLPTDRAKRAEAISWLMWQMGAGPFIGGGFGHFFTYAPVKIEYAIDRFAMEAKRQLHLLDTQLGSREFVAGDEYTVADIAIWPWYGGLVRGQAYEGADRFLNVQEYPNLLRWAEQIARRPAVKRGRIVNRKMGEPQLLERHSASDFDGIDLG